MRIGSVYIKHLHDINSIQLKFTQVEVIDSLLVPLYRNLLPKATMKALLVIAVLVTLLTLCHAIQTEYFLRPNDSNPCPRLPCHTLSHNIEITTQYFASNARIFFLPGVHKVTKFLCCTLKLFQISSLLDIACLGQLFQKCKDHLHETSNSGLLESSEFGDETFIYHFLWLSILAI